MSQANVYTTVSNAIWYTDRCEIVTGNTTVTYNIYEVAVGPNITFSGTTSNGSNVISSSVASNLSANSIITGAGIPANTTVSSQVVGTNVTISANATSSGTNVFTVAPLANGNMYSNAPQVASSARQQIYVGAGNHLTISGTNFTARELGTASSATAGVNGQG
jgi:hypothetical protein